MKKGKGSNRRLSKSVVALNEQLARRRNVRKLSKRFLVVCEDDKSAPNYFDAFKRHFNIDATSVVVAGSGGRTQPIQVVNRALDLKTQAESPESGTEAFEEVWCLIDGDYGSAISNARASAAANNIELAISTMCFEYWVLLHFEESNTPTKDCEETIKLLKSQKHIPKYDKGKYDFGSIVPDAMEASKRAEKLRKQGLARHDLPEEQNPCTEVYRLVNALLDA